MILEGVSPSPHRDEPSDEPIDQSELVAVLREQLAAERRVHAEARRIIAGLVERIPALEASESSASPYPYGEEPRSAAEEPHTETSRPWWRFWR